MYRPGAEPSEPLLGRQCVVRRLACNGRMYMATSSPIIDAALAILADGKVRTADDILAEGLKRGLFGPDMTRKYVYTSLSQYIERSIGVGRKPELLQDAQRRFLLNRPPDDWPNIDTTGLASLSQPAALDDVQQAAITRAQHADTASDPLEYELAVCDLFSALGFATTHIGGNAAPDGYADALLGAAAYRVMIECKTSNAVSLVRSSAPAEASKFKDPFHGDYCTLVAPAFAFEPAFVDELRTHGVCAWRTADLMQVLQAGARAYDIRSVFSQPVAADAIEDLLWERTRGRAKHLRFIASIVVDEARKQQAVCAQIGATANAPHFTVDVAIALVDSHLTAAGSSHACTREDVEAVFAWLTSPLVGRAFWLDQSQQSIIVI